MKDANISKVFLRIIEIFHSNSYRYSSLVGQVARTFKEKISAKLDLLLMVSSRQLYLQKSLS